MDTLAQAFTVIHAWLFETIVQPALYYFGLMAYAEDAFSGVEVFLYGSIEIGLLVALFRPLEWWRPVERWTDRRGVRVDVLYTLLNRLGILPLAFFVLLRPLVEAVDGTLRLYGLMPGNLEDWLPPLAASPLAAFLAYVVVLDLAEYWRHRLQHRFGWWWSLHALHHSQRQLSFWADNRNHLLDDLIAGAWFALVALVIGVPPGQFVFIALMMRMVESLSHANARISFGRVGERLLVSPHYHRIHHGIGVGHEGRAHGCNFATLYPVWDAVFGTASFARDYPATGIRDQLEGVDYGEGFWRQQALGLKRLWASLLPARLRTSRP